MLDFTGVKEITIPEGKAKKITRKSNGVVLWEKVTSRFTNVLKIASSVYVPKEQFYQNNHTIYGEDYNADGIADGYKINTRIGSTGAITEGVNGMCASGYIPTTYGDVIRIKNISLTGTKAGYIVHYQNGAFSTVQQLSALGEPDEYGVYTYTYKHQFNNAIRLSVGTIDENSIITVNEEIT